MSLVLAMEKTLIPIKYFVSVSYFVEKVAIKLHIVSLLVQGVIINDGM